jgi:hypothetical protein
VLISSQEGSAGRRERSPWTPVIVRNDLYTGDRSVAKHRDLREQRAFRLLGDMLSAALIPGASCGCGVGVAHAGWSPGAARLARSNHLTSLNAAHRWFFAENYGEASAPVSSAKLSVSRREPEGSFRLGIGLDPWVRLNSVCCARWGFPSVGVPRMRSGWRFSHLRSHRMAGAHAQDGIFPLCVKGSV